ncbi:MAG: hypothetical protein QG635_2313, partial [Bacteroidota bacterium]|nr:hypothetical protein [Bacteroidota bacterium]
MGLLNKLFFGKQGVPVILQNQSAESGSVSLAMISAFYGLFMSAEKMREACGVTSNGTDFKRIAQAARSFGFEVTESQCSASELRDKKLPAIFTWKGSKFSVVKGVGKESFHINDPESGEQTIPAADFEKDFSGSILEIKPGPNFKKGGLQSSILR